MPISVSTYDMLFKEWDLSTWANILEVVGTTIAIASFIVALFINRQVKELKRRGLFHRTIPNHLAAFERILRNINRHLDDYDGNIRNIQTNLSDLFVELEILEKKVKSEDSIHISNLKGLIKSIRRRGLSESGRAPQKKISKYIYKKFNADDDDVWDIYLNLRIVIIKVREIQNNTPII